MRSPFRLSIWALLLLVAPLAEAEAASRLCRQIEASLAGGGGSGGAYDRAIAAQRAAIDETRRRLHAPACNGWGRAGAACGALTAALPKMQANLRTLRAKRAGMGVGKAERVRLRAALAANGCRGAAPRPVEAKAAAEPAVAENAGAPPDSPAIRFARPAGARSICVRVCDGYFFPMTPTRAPVDDQSNCEAACPGTPMEVFYRGGGGDASMSSAATGGAYRELGTAFQFRDGAVEQAPGCGCNRIAARLPMQSTDEMRKTLAGAPAVQPAAMPASERKVRVVAPAFLPDPEAAIDLRSPAPSGDR